MRVLTLGEPGFEAAWRSVVARTSGGGGSGDDGVVEVARAIVDDVRDRGDAALLDHTARLDGWGPDGGRPAALAVPPAALAAAWEETAAPVRQALALAADRIRRYHERQAEPAGWEGELYPGDGVRVGWRTAAVRRAGVYVPGGAAAYPSTVLMNVIPAQVAGVDEIVIASPTPGGAPGGPVWAAAHLLGGAHPGGGPAPTVLRIGGAQAIAALAYGTATVPRCDVVAGPGNAWVAAAKRVVAGRALVAVDMEAGPSEVLVVADASADPDHVAADLLAQAEHDPRAAAGLILVAAPAAPVEASLARRLEALPRAGIARRALSDRGFIVVVPEAAVGGARAAAARLADEFAAEHLELLVERPRELLPAIRAAGAVFLGPHTPEALGDYVAGPNHVLPTAGAARFASPLSVRHFLTRTSILEATPDGLRALAPHVEALARAEGLDAHAEAVRARCGGGGPPLDSSEQGDDRRRA